MEQTAAAVTESFRRYGAGAAGGGSYDYAQHQTSGFSGTRAWFGATLRGRKINVVGVTSTSWGTTAIYIGGHRQGHAVHVRDP